jgi:hypothetical protein
MQFGGRESTGEGARQACALALILTGSVLTDARPNDPPAEDNQLAAAIIDVARPNNLSL